jgi:hypothetical protein
MWKVLGWFLIGVSIVLGVGSNALTIWQIILLGLPSPIWTAIAFALFSAGLITLVLEFRKEIQIKKGDTNEELAKTTPSISNTQITALSDSDHRSSKVERKAIITSSEQIVVDVTPEYLTGFFKEYTDIQAKKLAAPYIGKWMKISGPLEDVGEFSGYACQVTFADRLFSTSKTTVFMYFKKEWIERLSILKRNDSIAVLGKIKDVTRVSVSLDNCELVN